MESRHCGPDVNWTAIAVAHRCEKLKKRKKKIESVAPLQSAFTRNDLSPGETWKKKKKTRAAGAESRRCNTVLIFTSSASDWVLLSALVESWTVEPSGADPTSAGCWWELTSDDSTLCGGGETLLQHVAPHCNSHTGPSVSPRWWWAVPAFASAA